MSRHKRESIRTMPPSKMGLLLGPMNAALPGCLGKHAFPTRAEAQAKVDKANAELKDSMTVYKCSVCPFFHYGHRRESRG